MKDLRFRVIILTCYLAFFYVAGRLLDPVPFNLIMGWLVLAMVVVLAIPRMRSVLLWALMLVPIAGILVTKIWTANLSGDRAIFQVAFEVGALTVTAMLSRWVNHSLEEFENAVTSITLGQREKMIEFPLSGEGSIYREVRRARNHQRPLALISIGVDEKSIKPETEKIVQEIQQAMMKQFKLRGLSKVLCEELEDCSVIVQDNDHYMAVLPEIMPEELSIVVARLRQRASELVGVKIKIGVATLPRDSYTFDGLVENAKREMETDGDQQPYVVMDSYPLQRRINK